MRRALGFLGGGYIVKAGAKPGRRLGVAGRYRAALGTPASRGSPAGAELELLAARGPGCELLGVERYVAPDGARRAE